MTSKKNEDFSAVVTEEIPRLQAVANRSYDEAFDGLLALEKKTRQGEDDASTARVCVALATLAYEKRGHTALIETINLLIKRRGQASQSVVKMVQKAMELMNDMEDSAKMEVIENLCEITSGKMYVEVERARLTLIRAHMMESDGDAAAGFEILQEIAVETLGAMEKREKTEFILEQVRMALEAHDYIRAPIIARKVSSNLLNDLEYQDLKQRYYLLMVRMHDHGSEYLDIARSYLAIYNTPEVKADDSHWPHVLEKVAMYVVLAAYTNDQQDLLHRVYADENLETLPTFKSLLRLFTTHEVMSWPEFVDEFRNVLYEQQPVFTGEKRDERWGDLRRRVSEHNTRTIARYYRRITLKRFAAFLHLSEDESEGVLRDMVVENDVYARIDRPAGVIVFEKPKSSNETLNAWSENVTKLLGLVEDASHGIQKEHVMHMQDA